VQYAHENQGYLHWQIFRQLNAHSKDNRVHRSTYRVIQSGLKTAHQKRLKNQVSVIVKTTIFIN